MYRIHPIRLIFSYHAGSTNDRVLLKLGLDPYCPRQGCVHSQGLVLCMTHVGKILVSCLVCFPRVMGHTHLLGMKGCKQSIPSCVCRTSLILYCTFTVSLKCLFCV